MNSQTKSPKSSLVGDRSPLPTRSDVLVALRDAGYPLEMRIASDLDAANWNVTPSWNYYDTSNGKQVSREIDIVAQSSHFPDELTAEINFHLLLECKLKRGGLVGFAPRRDGSFDSFTFERYAWTLPNFLRPPRKDGRPGIGLQTVGRRMGWCRATWKPREPCCTSFTFISQQRGVSKPQWSADQKDIYVDQLQPLMIGFTKYREQFGRWSDRCDAPVLNFASLVFVIDGPIWIYNIGKRLTLRKTPTISYYRHLVLDGIDEMFRIDFVSSGYLKTYMKTLADDQEAIVSRFKSDHELFNVAMQDVELRQGTA